MTKVLQLKFQIYVSGLKFLINEKMSDKQLAAEFKDKKINILKVFMSSRVVSSRAEAVLLSLLLGAV